MKKYIFKKALIATVLTVGASHTCVAFAASEARPAASATTALQSQVNRVSEQRVQEWVQGLQTAFSNYQIELKSYASQGNNALATIHVSVGTPPTDKSLSSWEQPFYIGFEVQVAIEHGIALEDHQISIARLDSKTTLLEGSTLGLFKLSDMLKEVFGGVEFDKVSIIKPSGDLHWEIKSTKSFEYSENNVAILMPSFSAVLSTYNGAQLARTNFEIPLITFEDTKGRTRFVIRNFRALQTDKPIRHAVFELNGHDELSFDQYEIFENGESLIALNDFKFVSDGTVDENKLIQNPFTMSGQGLEKISLKDTGQEGQPARKFSFDVAGSISNLPADNYLKLTNMNLNTFAYMEDSDEIEAVIADLLGHGARLIDPAR